jgi:DNA-binding NtrC family response regulator
MACEWKGNARELENVIERALALSDHDELQADDLPLDVAGGRGDAAITGAVLRHAAQNQLTLREVEDRYIDEILGLTGGNKVRAARILGIDRKTLYRRAERRAAESTGSKGRADTANRGDAAR